VLAWNKGGRRGCVVLPTGAGKSFVAELCMLLVQRSTLVVVPTIELLNQWYDRLSMAFGIEVGLVGGGTYDIRDVTITTYDSAYIHLERLGNRFGLVVFDEVHHLPGPSYSLAAEGSIAPFRLGLTATLERDDGAHATLDGLVGPLVYSRDVTELRGEYLAEYTIETVEVELEDDERERYEEARGVFRGFVADNRIALSGRNGWQQFLQVASRSRAGRRAFQAHRVQRRIALAPRAKLRVLEGILRQHHGDRVLVFTNDNDTVYRIARELLVPAITHQTGAKERKEILDRFREGRYRTIVTSRVLNEGVDVPSAGVGVVLSGTGTVREHVQRLGRILRRSGDKQAVLYEVVTAGTVEQGQSRRRRQHDAYR
jgi:superfamily II DNA or RNA helicase